MTRVSFFKSLAVLIVAPSIISEVSQSNKVYCISGPNGECFYWIDGQPLFDSKNDKIKWVTVQDNFRIEYVV